jgi:type II secretory ATPase GspE/PulE/Tfp pilus assembly ATPase PilB-like protein
MVKKRLGEMLLEAGIIDEHKLQAALGHQRKWGGRLGQALVDLKLATEPQIVTALSRKFGYQVVPQNALAGGPMLESALRLVPREFASRHDLIPFAMDSSTIWVAMSDPANIAVVDEIRFRTGRRVQIALAGDREIADAVRRHYFADQDAQPVKAIPLEVDADLTPPETVVEQFGGGSTAAFDDFFSRPPEAAPVAAPGPVLDPVAFPSTPAPAAPYAPAAMPDGAAIDLEDLLSEETPALQAPASPVQPPRAGARQLSAREDPEAIELPLEEAEPEPRATSEHAVLEALDHLAHGEPVAPEVVKPAQMMAALVRLLLHKKVISEEEFLAEFQRK